MGSNTGSSTYSYYISNDTIYTEHVYMMLVELSNNQLTIDTFGSLTTGSTGALLYHYGEYWFFDRR